MTQLQLLFVLAILGTLGFGSVLADTGSVELGKPAPDFTLLDQDSVEHTLSDYQGQWVLVYFYPKDNTSGCTLEACTFRDNYGDFNKAGVKVFGISTDDVASHKAFAADHNLPFSLLADADAEITKLYGVKMPLLNVAKRHSFLIDPEGKIRKIYEDVTPADHPDEILNDLKAFQ